MASRLQDVLLRGLAAARPAASAVAAGTLYFATDTAATTQSDGTAWASYSAGAGSVPGHAASHAAAGVDPVSVLGLGGYPGGTTTFLRADGAFAAPASAGALVLLETRSGTGAAALACTTRNAAGHSGATFQTDFDHYRIDLIRVLPGTDSAKLYFEVSTDGGATWLTASGTYKYMGTYFVYTPTYGQVNDGSYLSTAVLLADGMDTTAAPGLAGAFGSVELWRPASAEPHRFIATCTFRNAGDLIDERRQIGTIVPASALNAIRLTVSTGTVASGTIRVYGIAG